MHEVNQSELPEDCKQLYYYCLANMPKLSQPLVSVCVFVSERVCTSQWGCQIILKFVAKSNIFLSC